MAADNHRKSSASNPPSRREFIGAAAASGLLASRVFAAEPGNGEPAKIGQTPHTKFAVNIEMWWRKLPFADRIRKTAELGFPAVEFWPLTGKGKDLDEISKLSQDLNVEIAQFTAWGFVPGLNDPKNHDAFLKAIETGCAAAQQLRCRKMTVVGGNDQPGMTQEEMHANIVAGLKKAAPLVEEADVMIILEPMNIRVDHKGHSLYGSDPAIAICEAVGSSHVKINWDLYHMQITEGDLCGHLREGMKSGQIGYLQLADHPGRNEPGTGEIFYPRVLREAYELGYRDFVGLECRPKEDELTAAKRVAIADRW